MRDGVSTQTRSIVVFDLGGVLIDWNPRYLFRQLSDDAAAVERFLAETDPSIVEIDLEKARAELERAKTAGEYDTEAEAEEALRRAEARIRAVERAS